MWPLELAVINRFIIKIFLGTDELSLAVGPTQRSLEDSGWNQKKKKKENQTKIGWFRAERGCQNIGVG